MATATETRLKEIRDEIHMLNNLTKERNRILNKLIESKSQTDSNGNSFISAYDLLEIIEGVRNGKSDISGEGRPFDAAYFERAQTVINFLLKETGRI